MMFLVRPLLNASEIVTTGLTYPGFFQGAIIVGVREAAAPSNASDRFS
jgi:hypothetical protein